MAIELSDGMDHSPETRQESAIAIRDILEGNLFRPKSSAGGPYRLVLKVSGNRLLLDIKLADFRDHGRLLLSLTPLRRVLRDYQTVCQTCHAAARESQVMRLEALDHGRRSLHDEGARMLMERLQDRIELDFATARRLFTLVSALSPRGA